MQAWFANPWALGLLALAPVLGGAAVWGWWRRRRGWSRLGYPPTLSRLIVARRGHRVVPGTCVALALILLVAGVAGPRWGRDWEQAAPGRDLVVLLDVSRTMQADDVPPSRLSRARQWLQELSQTSDLQGDRLALVVFAGRPLVVCPLTHDFDFFRESLASLDGVVARPELRPTRESPSGTRIGAGLSEAVQAHDPRFQGFQDILLISDGDDPVPDDEWRIGGRQAQALGIPVHVVGIGDPKAGGRIPVDKGYLSEDGHAVRSFLDEGKLNEIAQMTAGTYTRARTKVLPVGAWFRTTLVAPPPPDENDESLPTQRLRYAWFFAGGLLFLTLEMVGGWLRFGGLRRGKQGGRALTPRGVWLVFLVALALVGAARKDDPETAIRKGTAAFERGDYAAALDGYTQAEIRTTDPGLVAFNKAAALYRLGDYDQAAQHYRRSLEDAEGTRRTHGLFNLGNALLQGSNGLDVKALVESIRAYDACLREAELDPELRGDVVYNRELARHLFQQAKAAAKPPGPGGSPNSDSRNPFSLRIGMDGMPVPDEAQADARGAMESESPSGQDTRTTSQNSPPGAGNLPSLADSSELVPLTAEQAEEHLRAAVGRMHTDQQQRVRAQLAVPRRPLDR